MASESILIISAPSATAADAQPTFAVRTYAMVSDYWALTKPEVNFLIAMATSPASIWVVRQSRKVFHSGC